MLYWGTGILALSLVVMAGLYIRLCFRLKKQEKNIQKTRETFHDFRNLLTGVQGAAEMLVCKLDAHPELKLYAEAIMRAGEQARRMIAGEDEKCHFQNFSLNNIVCEAVSLLKHSSTENIKITCDNRAVPDTIFGAADWVRRLIMNLCVNAIEAMPDGGELLVITDSCELKDEDLSESLFPLAPGRYIVLEVRDTGIGIDAAVISEIFKDEFTTKPTGSGTGLSVVKKAAVMHGAGLVVRSESGSGCCFKVFFPAVNDMLHCKVLIVDDDPLLRNLLGDMLEMAGVTVLKVGSGLEAVEICKRNQDVDAVVLDMVMPEMSGKEVYDLLLRQNPNLKVIFVSGGDENIPSGKNVAFLGKPYQMTEVIGTLRLLLATEQDS